MGYFSFCRLRICEKKCISKIIQELLLKETIRAIKNKRDGGTLSSARRQTVAKDVKGTVAKYIFYICLVKHA